VSKHLTVLDCVGLVDGEKSGREMRYRLNVERLDRATRSLGELAAAWDQRLMRIKQIAETAAAKQPKK
jgi:DNA-binding transcriptional ArsR family regulator